MALFLVVSATVGSAGQAAAATAPNDTPATAIGFSSVPYDSYGSLWVDNPAATDPAGQLVATTCNGGSDVYGTTWWKYTAASASTFVVHAALAVGGPSVEEPIGLAVVSAGLLTVQNCGVEGSSISDAGAFTLDDGQSVYIVTFFRVPTEPTVNPHIGVYPSTGVAATNDDFGSATPITSLPYTANLDTTLATREAMEPVCYSKFGLGPSVWYSVTVPTSQRLDVSISSDFWASMVIASSLEDQTTWQCYGATGQLAAQAGVTYLIGIYGVDEVRNSGLGTIHVEAVPAAPSVSQLTIAATGTVNKKTGLVQLSGQVTCSGSTATNPVTGTLTQEYRRVAHTRSFTGTGAACTSTSARWTATVTPADFRFTSGQVSVTASVTACNSGGCTTADTKQTVKLSNK